MPSSKAIVRQRMRAAIKELERGRPAAARPLLEQALSLDRDNAEANAYLGVALLHSGQAQQAASVLDRAARAMPQIPWIFAHLGDAWCRCGDLSASLAAYERARALEPANPAYQMGAANTLAMQGRYDAAAEIFEALLRRDPGNAHVWFNLGTARRDQGRPDAAVRCFSAAVEIQPDWADARNSLGSALHSVFRLEEAEQAYRACVKMHPDEPSFRLNLASVLIDLGRFDEAEEVCRDSVTRRPDLAIARSFLGAALSQQGKLIQALDHEARAAELDPSNAHLAENYALALAHVGRFDAAWPAFDHALTLDPAAHTARYGKALAMLEYGRLSEGWEGYQHRPSALEASVSAPHRRRSLPDAPALNAGATVHLVSEQGLGDELFFLRFARLVAGCGGRVVYGASPRLREFLQQSAAPIAAFVDPEEIADQHFMLIGDLPSALYRAGLLGGPAAPATTGSTVAETGEYPAPLGLTPSTDRMNAMAARLRACGPPPYLALTWRGGVPPRQQGMQWTLHKSVPLEPLAEVLREIPGTLISVQRHPEAEETREFSTALSRTLHDFSAANDALDDMLALLACVDEYLCVSNTNTHIRAGTGRPARVLVPGPAEWRWPRGQCASPWFPGCRVYHQKLDGDWTPALNALRRDLIERS